MTRIYTSDPMGLGLKVQAEMWHRSCGDGRVRAVRVYRLHRCRDGSNAEEYLLTRYEGRHRERGRIPMSALLRVEGYGDVHRQMVGVSAAMKQLKKDIDDLVAYVNTQDVQEAMRALDSLEVKAKVLSYEALRMCETVMRYKRTVKNASGGDLLDLLNDVDPDADE